MKILLAYGSALSRIDDMKLFGGVSGGRTGHEILEAIAQGGDASFPKDKNGHTTMQVTGHDLRVLTNPWTMHPHWPGPTFKFRTWEEYRDLLYAQCEEWHPDIVLCAPAVSNYTPRYVVENQGEEWPLPHVPCVKGKVDSRRTSELLISLKRTPNIIGGVRNLIGKDAVLVGFKLTSHGDVDQLIEHARHVIKEARCDLVVANDLQLGLGRKFLVTPVGWWEAETKDIVSTALDIQRAKRRGFYRSLCRADVEPSHKDVETKTPGTDEAYTTACSLWERLGNQMKPHGCLAVRIKGGGFVTTTRGKEDLYTGVQYTPRTFGPGVLTAVWNVDHETRTVLVGHHQFSQEKATLNAPLLARMFEIHPNVKVIVHLHRFLKDVPTVPYTPPGTIAEARLANLEVRAFNIKGHGCIASFTSDDLDAIMKWVENPCVWQP